MLILALFSFFLVGVADRESSDGSPFANHCSLEHARGSDIFCVSRCGISYWIVNELIFNENAQGILLHSLYGIASN